jgi:GT2 family glycosyltransferase
MLSLQVIQSAEIVNHSVPKRPDIISFVVPTLNEEKHIGRCLESILRLEVPSHVNIEILVVDNQSADRTVEISRGLGARVIEVAPGHPSRARNTGARAARGGWLAFIDADCQLPPNWLSMCGSHLLNGTRVVAAAGTMCRPHHASPWVEHAWHTIAHRQTSAAVRSANWLPAFNLLVDRSAFESVGGFDESLRTCEDCDLGYKLAELGTLVLDPGTQVNHFGESRSLRELFRREAWRSGGNLRLAVARPFDWSNWLSLLAPPCLVLGFLFSAGGLIAALAWQRLFWPSLAVLILVAGVASFLLLRKNWPANPLAFAQQFIVFSTYLAGRTAGILWSFRRVER